MLRRRQFGIGTDLAAGIVGEGAAIEFAAFLKKALTDEDMLRIVADPENAKIPKSLDGIYTLTSWLACSASDATMSKAGAVLLNRIPPEFGVVLARDLMKGRPAFAREPGYRTFITNHGHLLVR